MKKLRLLKINFNHWDEGFIGIVNIIATNRRVIKRVAWPTKSDPPHSGIKVHRSPERGIM